MVERRICPKDISIFIKLLTCQCKSGKVDAAYDVLKAMIVFNIPTEAGQYGILVENFFNTEAYDRAVNLLYELMEKEISPKSKSTLFMELSSYNTVIEYLCDDGQAQKADTLFRQLMLKGFHYSLPLDNLVHGHLKEGNPEAAFYIHKIMTRAWVSSESDYYRLLISSLLEKGKPDFAQFVLDSMIKNGHYPDSSLFRMIMEGLLKDEWIQTASQVMKTMLETGVKDNKDLAANILEALFMRGHVEEALRRIELLMQNGCAVDIDHLLSVLSLKGKTIDALRLLEFSLDRDFRLDFSSYDKVVLHSLVAGGKTLNAYSILCKMSSKGVSTDQKNIESLIKMLNDEGNTKQADILARLMMGDNCSQS